ncbi:MULTISPECIES: hypothetical protein [unclassified Actinotalea]|uniref:hypothetical protein n=1 Tax=unclassified Actinotalea TaxID=2638618 RepID=UPI0015F52117|nr:MULTISPECIES: hypothetical protein [unclassified Actinotalea]
MSNVLPFVALMSVPKNRRRRLMPIVLPAVAGLPAAQAGALAVVSADGVARREGALASAEAVTAVTAVLTTAVDKGAVLTAEDLAHIPLARQVVAADPDILATSSLSGVSRAELQRAAAVIQAALDADGDGKPAGGASSGAKGATSPPQGGGAGGSKA